MMSARIDTECCNRQRSSADGGELLTQQLVEIMPNRRLSRIAEKDFILERPSLFFGTPRYQLHFEAIVLNVSKAGNADDTLRQRIAVVMLCTLQQRCLVEPVAALDFPEFAQRSVSPFPQQLGIALSF
ncbi:hypothetical protein AS156_28545 [Bradyrhizobium macuxiense]|uniref:Uncharacterized protein n=1 Tax=Bradyrhizobium macuxiense TaxID=1755647 RepID=A0A125QAH4_9BRAD|nr:hypothetical protein AS156_28545 [Bradyrhizobium macuxiense]